MNPEERKLYHQNLKAMNTLEGFETDELTHKQVKREFNDIRWKAQKLLNQANESPLAQMLYNSIEHLYGKASIVDAEKFIKEIGQ